MKLSTATASYIGYMQSMDMRFCRPQPTRWGQLEDQHRYLEHEQV